MEKQIKVFSSIVILSIFNIFSAKIAERLIVFKNNSIDEVDYSDFVSAFFKMRKLYVYCYMHSYTCNFL